MGGWQGKVKTMKTYDDIEMFIALVPYGADNSVSREELTRLCVDCGLVSEKAVDKDRAMRKLLHTARTGCCILSKASGGYFRPTNDELHLVEKRNKQERSRAISIFANTKYDGLLAEDYRRGVFS